MIDLPINDVLDDLKSTLDKNKTLILEAPPGAGKSTRVPLALLDTPWLKEKMIVMLEPRRVAARMVATQMAKLLGEELGQRVGYQVKMDSLYSKETKILVVTEGILVRMLHSDETLEGVGLIIFDEFHERSIYSDLSLALSLQVQELLREDLKLLIMSATLNSEGISKLLGDVPIVISEGRVFDVESIYLDIKERQPDYKSLPLLVHKTLLNAIKNDEGDILVFLQGAKEIHRVEHSLRAVLEDTIDILPLYSALSKKEQNRALLPSERKKVILATNIAQTSLTIEGVRVVIDTGLEKLSLYNYASGMNHLESMFISKESATQRAGRAGRLSSGKCYRLWHENRSLTPSTKPEILRSDLASLLLDLALWGVKDFHELFWLDIPDAKVVQSTKELLQELEMLDKNFKITPFGRDAIALGVHPRFAYMILKSVEMNCAYEASLLAAMLSEKDIFNSSSRDSNLLDRFIHLYEKDFDFSYINTFRAKEVLKQADFFYSKLKKVKKIVQKREAFEKDLLGVLLLLAYPDRLAKRRGKNENRYKMSNAKGALLHHEDSMFNEEYLVVARLNANIKDSFINQALSISFENIQKYFSMFIENRESVRYNPQTKKFDIRLGNYFLALELESKPIKLNAEHDMKSLLLELVKTEGLRVLSWSKKALSLQERVNFLNANIETKLIDFSEKNLLQEVDSWLVPYLDNINSVKELESLDLYSMLLTLLTYEEQQELDRQAPLKVKVPSGSNVFINYEQRDKPSISVKIQELFGLYETPKVLGGKMPLQIELLSPAMRPIQITYDLESFWKNSYSEVRKELRGKYKRHYWPDDPYGAVATNKTKKQMLKGSIS